MGEKRTQNSYAMKQDYGLLVITFFFISQTFKSFASEDVPPSPSSQEFSIHSQSISRFHDSIINKKNTHKEHLEFRHVQDSKQFLWVLCFVFFQLSFLSIGIRIDENNEDDKDDDYNSDDENNGNGYDDNYYVKH